MNLFRISIFDIRPARNALKLVRGELNNLIHHTMLTLTQRTLHGRRVFDILRFAFNLLPSAFGIQNCLFVFPVIWKEQVVLVVGAAFSRDHFNSRLEAAPTGVFLIYLDLPDMRNI